MLTVAKGCREVKRRRGVRGVGFAARGLMDSAPGTALYILAPRAICQPPETSLQMRYTTRTTEGMPSGSGLPSPFRQNPSPAVPVLYRRWRYGANAARETGVTHAACAGGFRCCCNPTLLKGVPRAERGGGFCRRCSSSTEHRIPITEYRAARLPLHMPNLRLRPTSRPIALSTPSTPSKFSH